MKASLEEYKKLIGREFIGDNKVPMKLIHTGKKNAHPLLFVWGSDEEYVMKCGIDNNLELLPEIPEGFTRWFGGECPVPEGTKVEVFQRHRLANEDNSYHWGFSQNLRWTDEGKMADVIAYRVIEEEKKRGESPDWLSHTPPKAYINELNAHMDEAYYNPPEPSTMRKAVNFLLAERARERTAKKKKIEVAHSLNVGYQGGVITPLPEKKPQTTDISEWWEICAAFDDSNDGSLSRLARYFKKKEDAISYARKNFTCIDPMCIKQVSSNIVEWIDE